MTGPSSAGIAASCCAKAGAHASSMHASNVARKRRISDSGSMRRRRRRRGCTEVDARCIGNLGFVLDGEVRLFLVAEHLRREVLRELADVGVVILHGGDETPAR